MVGCNIASGPLFVVRINAGNTVGEQKTMSVRIGKIINAQIGNAVGQRLRTRVLFVAEANELRVPLQVSIHNEL